MDDCCRIMKYYLQNNRLRCILSKLVDILGTLDSTCTYKLIMVSLDSGCMSIGSE